MEFTLNRRAFITSALAAGALASTTQRSFSADPLKVGFVYSSPVGDFGWSYRHDVGRKDLEKEFGDAIRTTSVENVSEGPDSERVIERLARSGHELIFTCSFGYMEPTLKVAKKFPNVKFEHNTGYKTAPNVSVYNARFH